MPEARDRLSRQEHIITTYSNRSRNVGRGDSVIFVLKDEAEMRNRNEEQKGAGTPFRWRATSMVGSPGPVRGSFGTPRVGRRGSYLYRSPVPSLGRENMSPVVRSSRGGSGHGRGLGSSVLPYWYPRKPLRDITTIARAYERRRLRWGESEGLTPQSPILQDRIVHDLSTSTPDAPLEHDISTITPYPTTQIKRCPPTIGKVPRILLSITNQNVGDSASLTPQRKLLNNIDAVEKVVMKELQKLERTPSAKKAEREKRVRTLMSIR